MLHYTRLERLARNKHSKLLGPFESNEENEGLWTQFQAPKLGVKLPSPTDIQMWKDIYDKEFVLSVPTDRQMRPSIYEKDVV